MKCDNCNLKSDYVCDCSRCSREPDEDEKFHSCKNCISQVEQKHQRIRERLCSWLQT